MTANSMGQQSSSGLRNLHDSRTNIGIPPKVQLALVVVCAIFAGCFGEAKKSEEGAVAGAPGQAEPPVKTVNNSFATFADKTHASGIGATTYRNGEHAGHFAIVESLGGGVGLLDFGQDGWLDVIFPTGGSFDEGPIIQGRAPQLYRSVEDWRFKDASAHLGVDVENFFSHGAAVGDFNNDGWPDVVITGYGGLKLFENLGDGTFEECASSANLIDDAWSSTAAWGDINGDGHLDLFVAHYVDWSWENHPFCDGPKGKGRDICPPREFKGVQDRLFWGNGDGTFRDAAQQVALAPEGKGLGVILADVDLDGRLDVYVTNDTVPNFLYQNKGEGRLKEVGLESGTSVDNSGRPDGSMGVDLGDFNLDGLPDLWVANYEDESFALYRNDGDCYFTHVSVSHGVTALGGVFVGWGTGFADFDHDGDEDIFVSNGHVIRYPKSAPLRQPPLLLENQNGRRFVNTAPGAGEYMNSPHMGRGLAIGDFDNDGDEDVVVSHSNEPASILSNETDTQNHWLGVRVVGTSSSRDPVGAVIYVETESGTQIRQLTGGTSYASSNDSRQVFGLGESHTAKRIRIRWPSGLEQQFDNVSGNRFFTVIEGRDLLF